MGEEVLGIFAQVAKDPGLVARALHTADGGETSRPEVHSIGSAYPRWCRCGLCSEDDDPTFSCRKHKRDQDSVELVYLTNHSLTSAPMGTASSRINEHVRRRRGSVGMEDEDLKEDMAFQSAMEQYAQREKGQLSGNSALGSKLLHQTRELQRQSIDKFEGSKGATIAFFSSLGKAIGDSNLSKAIEQGSASIVDKIKRVASQPALAGANTSSLREAADGVLLSLKQGLLPKGPLPLPVSTGASAGRPPKPPTQSQKDDSSSAFKRGKSD